MLRVLIVKDYSDSYNGSVVYNYVDTSYYWYFANNNIYIAGYSFISINGSAGSPSASYIIESALNSINSSSKLNSIKIYPNPVQNTLYINNEQNQELKISIINLNGTKVKDIFVKKGERETKIDVSGIKPGLYLIKYSTKDDYKIEKVIIE